MAQILLLAAAAPTAEAKLLGMDAEYWVWTGIALFLVFAFWRFKAHRLIVTALDAHIAEARRTLDEAAAIRAEAEALLTAARDKLVAAKADAAQMLHRARDEAAGLIAQAEADTAALVARREKMATDKIAAAERAALASIRARAADGAVEVARHIIAKNHDAVADGALVDEAIGAL